MRELFSNLFPLWKVVFLMVEWISAKMIQFLYMICVAHTNLFTFLKQYMVPPFSTILLKVALNLQLYIGVNERDIYIIMRRTYSKFNNSKIQEKCWHTWWCYHIYTTFTVFGLHHRNRCKWYFSDRRFHRTLKTSFTSSLLCL